MLFGYILKWFFAPFFVGPFFANLDINSISRRGKTHSKWTVNGWRGNNIINIIIDFNWILFMLTLILNENQHRNGHCGQCSTTNTTNVDKFTIFFSLLSPPVEQIWQKEATVEIWKKKSKYFFSRPFFIPVIKINILIECFWV